MLIHGTDQIHSSHLAHSVLDLNGGGIVNAVVDGDIFIISQVLGLEVPGDLGRRLTINGQILQLEGLAGAGPNLVLVQVVPVDDWRD